MAKSVSGSIIDYYTLESPVATEVRRLLQSLRRKGKDKELKTIMVTSATTGEGKSTTCALTAVTAALKGSKTLLVDCDMRRPRIHRLFQTDREQGLADVLSEGVTPKSVIKKTSLETLDLVTAGHHCTAPSEVFDAPSIGRALDELKFYYDLIIIDSPPVIPVSDPMMLSQVVDGAVLVVKAGATPREIVKRAADIMEGNGGNLLGVVLNNIKGSLPYHYDYRRYDYHYEDSDSPYRKRKAVTKQSSPAAGKGKSSQSKKKSGSGDRTPRDGNEVQSR